MKRFSIRLSIAIFTFLVGLFAALMYDFFTEIPIGEVDSKYSYSFLHDDVSYSAIEIRYDWNLINRHDNKGIFVVTNRGKQTVYYLAYEKNQHFDNWIRQNGKIKAATKFICHMGMESQELKPDESVFFKISVPHNKKNFEAGFDFFMENNPRPKTFWVNVNPQMNYAPVYQD